MENQIKNKRKKLAISFAGCTKKDKKDNSDKNDSDNKRFNPKQINNCGVYQAEHISSQLFYKFE